MLNFFQFGEIGVDSEIILCDSFHGVVQLFLKWNKFNKFNNFQWSKRVCKVPICIFTNPEHLLQMNNNESSESAKKSFEYQVITLI